MSIILCILSSGSLISWMRSYPTCASHCLNGSALGDGMDWMILRHVCVFAQSVSLIFPSDASNFNCPIFADTSVYHSSLSLFLRSDRYFLASLHDTLRRSIISIIENHHSLLWITFFTSCHSNSAICCVDWIDEDIV